VLGAPVGTVKWRLHEAHGLVRAGLVGGRPLRDEPVPTADPWPPCCGVQGVPLGVSRLPGGWPPAALPVPAGAAVHFVVASQVGRTSAGFWVATDRSHHLWWGCAGHALLASGSAIMSVRAMAEEAVARG